MSQEENKTIARRITEEIWGKGNLALIDELFAPNYVDHNPMPGLAPNREGLKQSVTMMQAAFPDLHTHVDDLVAEGNKVVSRFSGHGTQKDELMGIPPTGKEAMVTGIQICHIVDGKVIEDWSELDYIGMMQQLGVVPPPG
jgi:predicted ester cyclase